MHGEQGISCVPKSCSAGLSIRTSGPPASLSLFFLRLPRASLPWRGLWWSPEHLCQIIYWWRFFCPF